VLGLELLVILGSAVLACTVAARRLRIAPPVLLLAAGVLLGLLPALADVHLPPEVVLLLFLPALLYWESLTTSMREIRSNLRPIVLMSTGLVVATAGAVAVVAHWIGLPWGPAWVLGAAVAPTDATAVGVLARGLPRRTVTVLRAESLVNDGTALVIYGIAVGVTVGEVRLGVGEVAWKFLVAAGGGALAGFVMAQLAIAVRRHLDDPLQENLVSVVTPFAAFLVADLIAASGVLAVVVCGLLISQAGPRSIRAHTRQQGQAFWGLSTYLLNSALFVLVGLQLPAAVRGLRSVSVGQALAAVALVSAAVIAVRFAWLFTTPYLIRTLDRRPQQRLRRVGPRPRVLSAVAGFRGAVSLAAALAVPEMLPARDVIIFVTSGVILVTLVLQAPLLPAVVRWAHLPEDTGVVDERRLAETAAAEAALAALPQVAAELGTDETVVARTRAEYEAHLRLLRADGTESHDDRVLRAEADYVALRLDLIARKRATVVRLRDERRIDDTVLRQIQWRLDVEEVRLAHRDLVE
jgi:CPA1 family monovalent cation:H+ antiporter